MLYFKDIDSFTDKDFPFCNPRGEHLLSIKLYPENGYNFTVPPLMRPLNSPGAPYVVRDICRRLEEKKAKYMWILHDKDTQHDPYDNNLIIPVKEHIHLIVQANGNLSPRELCRQHWINPRDIHRIGNEDSESDFPFDGMCAYLLHITKKARLDPMKHEYRLDEAHANFDIAEKIKPYYFNADGEFTSDLDIAIKLALYMVDNNAGFIQAAKYASECGIPAKTVRLYWPMIKDFANDERKRHRRIFEACSNCITKDCETCNIVRVKGYVDDAVSGVLS